MSCVGWQWRSVSNASETDVASSWADVPFGSRYAPSSYQRMDLREARPSMPVGPDGSTCRDLSSSFFSCVLIRTKAMRRMRTCPFTCSRLVSYESIFASSYSSVSLHVGCAPGAPTPSTTSKRHASMFVVPRCRCAFVVLGRMSKEPPCTWLATRESCPISHPRG